MYLLPFLYIHFQFLPLSPAVFICWHNFQFPRLGLWFIFCGAHHICPELASPAILQIYMISSNISEKILRKHHSNVLQVSLFIFCGVRHICPELASPVILQIFMISSNISEKKYWENTILIYCKYPYSYFEVLAIFALSWLLLRYYRYI